ncbi:6-bladed beta-propeller [Parabacteroides sp. Marseille-P3160]|uniref:6-bladed beta-propeller n=1 Tax=Parabacteroides sp. Marseille-P3160 TaxID=1917887 RepID=UPI0009BBAC9A|nr:6-bladed beta-propeller [Parabacteroides sp. Marseille-P3160]
MKALTSCLFLFTVFLQSCTTSQKGQPDMLIKVSRNDTTINASSFIKEIKVIKLETNSDLLISQIGKVQYIKGQLYLFDLPGNCLFIFNNDGSLYKKIKRIGGGPGEYVRLMDFYISKYKSFILDFAKQTIIQYDKDFNFIEQNKYSTFGSKFVFHNGNYWIYNEPSGRKNDYQYIVVDENGKTINQFLPRNFTQHTYNWAGVNSFYENNGVVYLSPRYNDTIYSINQNKLKTEYIIDFGKDKLPKGDNINSYDITQTDFDFLVKDNFYITNKYVIFDLNVKGNREYCIYDRNSKNAICSTINNDLIKDFRFFPRWGNDNYLIEEVSSELVLNGFKSSFQKEIIEDLKPDDNPIIIVYEIKD